MSTLTRFLALAATLVALTACSAHSGAHSPSASSAPTVDATEVSSSLICDRLADLGGTYTPDPAPELYVTEQGDCGPLIVYRFARASLRDKWLRASLEFGGIYVVGPDWAVPVDDTSTAELVASRLGGTVRS